MEKVKKRKKRTIQKKERGVQVSARKEYKAVFPGQRNSIQFKRLVSRCIAFCVLQWRLIFLMVVSVFLRTWDLNRLPLFGDLARDYMQAVQVLAGKSIPFLGIPSSIPRFSQGPFNVWFDVVSFILGGVSLYAPVILAAGLTSFGIGLLYRELESRYGQTIAFAASLLIATSPGAVIQSRAPFYLFAVPLCTLLVLLAAVKAREVKKKALFLFGLSIAVLLGWEMATLPIAGLALYVIWAKRMYVRNAIVPLFGGMLLGSFPKIIHDITHSCEQVCGLGIWAVYRVVAVTGFDGKHALTGQTAINMLSSSAKQFIALFGKNEPASFLIIFAICVYAGILLWKTRTRTGLAMYALAGTGLLLAGIGIHGVPSEAYFPPFLVFVPILAAYGIQKMSPVWKKVCIAVLIVISIKQGAGIVMNNFYANPVRDTVAAVEWISKDAQGKPIALRSFDQNAHFPTYLDVFRFLLLRRGNTLRDDGVVYTISLEENTVLPAVDTNMHMFGYVTVVSSMYNK